MKRTLIILMAMSLGARGRRGGINSLPLFPWLQIMGAMAPYEVKRHEDGDEAKQGRKYQAKMVEFQTMP